MSEESRKSLGCLALTLRRIGRSILAMNAKILETNASIDESNGKGGALSCPVGLEGV